MWTIVTDFIDEWLDAFDPKRRAICLVAGDKQGKWDAWYGRNIPLADDLYDGYLSRLKKGEEHG